MIGSDEKTVDKKPKWLPSKHQRTTYAFVKAWLTKRISTAVIFIIFGYRQHYAIEHL